MRKMTINNINKINIHISLICTYYIHSTGYNNVIIACIYITTYTSDNGCRLVSGSVTNSWYWAGSSHYIAD